MKKIEATAQFTEKGKIIPISFKVGKSTYRVHNLGRQWETEMGRHFLVMDMHQKTYHLIFNPQESVWRLGSGSQSPTIAV
ncbi:MAG: hypothetical protein MAG431_02237 [Chloroflexi bacterium]|nr:hypothetical protein [Chloroflexota bacterium]